MRPGAAMYKKTTGKYGTYQTYFYDTENNNWVWKSGSTYYLSAIVGLPITVDGGANINISGFLYNSNDYYTSGGLYYFYDSTNGYVATSYLGFGMTSDLAWWKCATLAGTYVKQGTAESDKVVAMGAVAGRSSATLAGVYTPVTGGGMTGDKYIGFLRYDVDLIIAGETTSGIFTQTLIIHNNKPTFSGFDEKYMWYDLASSKWIIGGQVGTISTEDHYCDEVEGTYLPFDEEGVLYLNYNDDLSQFTHQPIYNGKFSYWASTVIGALWLWWDPSVSKWVISTQKGTLPPNLRWVSSSKFGTYSKETPGFPLVPDTVKVESGSVYDVSFKDSSDDAESVEIKLAQVGLWL
jgi:hypothetical protein